MVTDGSWAQLDKQGDAFPFDDLPPPTSAQPGPKRFSFDANETMCPGVSRHPHQTTFQSWLTDSKSEFYLLHHCEPGYGSQTV